MTEQKYKLKRHLKESLKGLSEDSNPKLKVTHSQPQRSSLKEKKVTVILCVFCKILNDIFTSVL